jgi:SRSO17 transposase
MLLLDETSFFKKGTQSVGVARQYCGCSGKIENGHVAVLGALGCGQDVTLVDYRLYLPESWTTDAKRLNRAKVPEGEREFYTKPELALKIVETAVENELQFGWVSMDSLYGASKLLLKALEDKGLQYLADVRSNQKFYFQDSSGAVHEKRVDKIWRDYAPSLAQNVSFRNATKGTLKAQVLVIALCDKDATANDRSLVISCDGTGAIKYSLTNAQGSSRKLCYRQHQRYWIERAIQEAKSEVGMAQYQVRGWFGWHQLIAMVTLAMLFALRQKVAYRGCVPLLSTHDIVELLSYYLPSKKDSEEEIFKQMVLRHTARLKSIEHYYRKRSSLSLNYERLTM